MVLPVYVPTSSGNAPSFATLVDALRVRLNDVDEGNYSDTELKACINLAYRETAIAACCHIVSTTIASVVGQGIYYCDSIFSILEVSTDDKVLLKKRIGDMGVSMQGWNAAANGTPKEWMCFSGSWIRISPAPSAIIDLHLHGYGVGAPLVQDADIPSAIPIGFVEPAILTRAEAEAWKMRRYIENGPEMLAAMIQEWRGWCKAISDSIRGDM